MPTKLSVYKMWRSTLTGIKSIRRKKQKQKIIEASHKIGITNHWSDRLYIPGSETSNILTVLGSSVIPRMLSFHSRVIFILSESPDNASVGFLMSRISQTSLATNQISPSIMTVRIDNRESVLDRYYKPLTVWERRAILLWLWLKL